MYMEVAPRGSLPDPPWKHDTMSGEPPRHARKDNAPERHAPGEGRRARLLRHENRGLSPLYALFALPEGCERVFFPGCGLPAVRPATVLWAFERLRVLDPRAGVVLSCCGRPSLTAGFPERGRAVAKGFLSGMAARGVREVVTGCPGCREALAGGVAGSALRIRSVEEVFLEAGVVPGARVSGVVAVHDPCPTRHDGGAREVLRRAVAATGLAVEEMPRSGARAACCGAGVLSPDKARAARSLRIAEAGGRLVVTSCAGCVQSLGRGSAHVLDLLRDPARVAGGGARPLPLLFGRLGRLWVKGRLRGVVAGNGQGPEASP